MNREEPTALDRPDVRPQLLARWHEARSITDALFDGLRPEVLYQRPIAERHRIIFYLGHLEAFDWNLLTSRRAVTASAVNAGFNQLFAFGIDPVGTGLPQDLPGDWPDLQAIHVYRQSVRDGLDKLMATLPVSWPGPWAGGSGRHFDAACLLNVAVEHRLMHAETLAYMLHRLPVGSWRVETPMPQMTHTAPAPKPAMVSIPSGNVMLGESRANAQAFGWDNEFPAHEVGVPAFSIDRHMVTNGQYLAFMADGGYERPEFWKPQDWAWRESHGIRQPVFWRCDRDGWLLRAMHHDLPLPLDWPVYVSHAEASAYACWAGKALPTEAQWMRAASGVQLGEGGPCNANFRQWDPEPVQACPQVSDFGVVGMFGNGWEWTRSVFEPAEGFEAFPFYPGYSKDFFDGKHFVLKGGSPRTAACMLRPSFRNWFQAHYQHVYAGLRCVSAD
ncbi:SUMF1/EgtB/PvdO family nonheme iron enzyme [Aquabacterium sp. CECT 9606]|uniref:SUMF1/EgtB/PvdO family nonheme iron enzyme n=1 Tax=Aquabacterium sp. CECT 9606 TaxID=2845822 RepID=UPI001E29B81F|nr:SUMF1/EgtB/PvdO family nonheme iron enzyme [Aquabacterium sp. CECT 9606]CAH0354953.1 Hercynine oxygenase [Aquabacterium sp. CECT 9606]